MTTPLIELDGLTQAYGRTTVLQGLTASIPRTSVGLVGANGAGKSTLMKTLLGILKPTSGEARVLGLSVSDDTVAMRERVGYMPERGGLPPDQTAADFMIYAAELAGIPSRAARQRASDVLTLVGLHEERFRHLLRAGPAERFDLSIRVVSVRQGTADHGHTHEEAALKYLCMIRVDENTGQEPSERLEQEMGKLFEEWIRDGKLVRTAGLLPTREGFRVRSRHGAISTTDGPFTETKEVIGGYAIIEAKDRDEALELTKQFLAVHGDEWDVECEVRPLAMEEFGP